MRRIALLFNTIFLLAIEPACYAVQTGQLTTLQSLLDIAASAQDKGESLPLPFVKLRNAWVGDVSGVDGKAKKVKLTYGRVRDLRVQLGSDMIGSMSPVAEDPIYMEKLPASEVLKRLGVLQEFEDRLGKAHRTINVTEGDELSSTIKSWAFVTHESDQSLRYVLLSVKFAPRMGNGDYVLTASKIRIDEGLLSRMRMHDTKDGLPLQDKPPRESSRVEAIEEQLPSLVLELVYARRAQGDHLGIKYQKKISEIRANPNPELFRQLIGAMGDGTAIARGHLVAVLVDAHGAEPWDPQRKLSVVKKCVELLPIADPAVRSDLVIVILRAIGGGTVGVGRLKIGVQVLDNGYRTSREDSGLNVSVEETQKRLTNLAFQKGTAQ